MKHVNPTTGAAWLLATLGATATPVTAQTTVGGAVRIDAGRGPAACNETTISAAASNPLEIVAGWNDYRQGSARTGVGLSLDGGATWTDFLLRPPAPFQAATEGDPMTAYDDRTGTIWAGGISFASNGGVFVARKDPGAAAFGPVVMAEVTGGADKGWMAAGVDPNDPDATRVYVAYNEGVLASGDMGDTWSGPVNLGFGLGFLPRVGPGGELYVAYWDLSDEIRLARSFDGGATFVPSVLIAQRMDVWGIDGSRVPGDYRVASLQGFAVDPHDGTLYVVYPDTTDVAGGNFNVDVYFTKSVDQGANWSVPVVINDDAAPTGDQFFPWIECDRDGRLHVLYYDTRHNAQNDSAPQGLIDATYAYSDDGGASWTEERLTATSFTSANDGFGGAFIGDYLGLTTAGRRTLPVYMSTNVGANANVFVNAITRGPATELCFGIECPCGNEDSEAGCGNAGSDGSPATGARMTAGGTASIAADDLTFTVEGVAPGLIGIVLASQTTVGLPFGNGQRCFGSPFFRYAPETAGAGGSFTLGPADVVSQSVQRFGPGGQLQAGATWHYQTWYRDPTGPCGATFNTTNALSVTWVP